MRISVVIPTKSQYKELSPTLKSLWKQNHSNFEVMVVISPPQPYLRRTLAKVMQQEARLKFLELDQPGTNIARNRGAEMATGELVLFLDDDCVLPSDDYLKNLENLFWAGQNLVGLGGFYLTPNKSRANCRAYNAIVNAWLLGSSQEKAQVLVGGCSAYKRLVFLEHGGFDESVQGGGEELRINERLAQVGELRIDRRLSVLHSFNGPVTKFLSNSLSHGRGHKGVSTGKMNWRQRSQFLQQALKVDRELDFLDQIQVYSRAGVYSLGLQIGKVSKRVY